MNVSTRDSGWHFPGRRPDVRAIVIFRRGPSAETTRIRCCAIRSLRGSVALRTKASAAASGTKPNSTRRQRGSDALEGAEDVVQAGRVVERGEGAGEERRGDSDSVAAASEVIWLRGAWRRKQIRSSGARPWLEMRPSPCQGVPYDPDDVAFRAQDDALVAQDLHARAPEPEPSHRRLAGPGLAGEERAPPASASTTPLPWMATPAPPRRAGAPSPARRADIAAGRAATDRR